MKWRTGWPVQGFTWRLDGHLLHPDIAFPYARMFERAMKNVFGQTYHPPHPGAATLSVATIKEAIQDLEQLGEL